MNNRLIGILTALLGALVAYMVYTSYEYYEEETDTGWQKEARRNHFLAAELYGKKIDIAARSYDSYLDLDSLEDFETVFIAESGQVLSEKRLMTLLEWVHKGGHLIVAAQQPSDWNNDRILEYFDLTATRTDFESIDNIFDIAQDESTPVTNEDEKEDKKLEDTDTVDKDSKQSKKFSDKIKEINKQLGELSQGEDETLSEAEKIEKFEQSIASKELTELRFENTDYTLKAHFSPGVKLGHPSFENSDFTPSNYDYELVYWAGDDWGLHLVQIEKGAGLVSVLSDPSIIDSNNIGYFDHAFLWQILIEGGNQLAIIYGSDMPSLWFMLKTYMPEVLLAFSLFVLAWLWYQIPRFGAVRVSEHQVRRSILEHISASSHFLWKGGWQRKLIKPVQDDIKRQAEKIIPAYSTASEEQQITLLATQANLNPDAVRAAMQALDENNEERFVSHIKVLQRIKDSL